MGYLAPRMSLLRRGITVIKELFQKKHLKKKEGIKDLIHYIHYDGSD